MVKSSSLPYKHPTDSWVASSKKKSKKTNYELIALKNELIQLKSKIESFLTIKDISDDNKIDSIVDSVKKN